MKIAAAFDHRGVRLRNAVLEASKTVKGIKSIWIDNFSAEVAGDKITSYRVNAKISFVLEGHK